MIQTCKQLLEGGICAVYIPLNKIKFKRCNDPIKEYIYKQIMGCDNSLFRNFENMANADIQGNVFLFLDGVNELPVSEVNVLYEFIKGADASRKWSGTGIVLSSRTDMDLRDIKILNMLPIEQDKIYCFLEKFSVKVPQNEKVLKLVDNPFRLCLYADAEKYAELYKRQGGRFKIKLEAQPDTATKIIWNFMQTQLF